MAIERDKPVEDARAQKPKDVICGALSTYALTASRLTRNPCIIENPAAAMHAANQGLIDLKKLKSTPENVVRTARTSYIGSTPLGIGANTNKEFTVDPQLKKFVPNINNATTDQEARHTNFSGAIQITPRVTLGAFLGAENGSANPSNISEKRQQEIFKYLYIQAELLSAARTRPEFNGVRIAVEEGIYDFDPVETTTEGTLADLASIGRAIAYACKDISGGDTNVLQTFALAEYFASLPWYDKIILDYYNFEPNENDNLNMRVYIVLPELDEEYNGTFGRKKETVFNGKVQSQSLLLLD